MIRITDRTLSCLDHLQNISAENIEKFLVFLIQAGVDAIEISEKIFSRLTSLPDFNSYILRVNHPADAVKFPRFRRFVCRNAMQTASGFTTEIQLNDMRDVYTITRYGEHEKVRVIGLDDFLIGDYLRHFTQLKAAFRAVEFCPTNRFFCATALAAEWVSSGAGNEIVTAFGGLGGFAATEELILILRVSRLRKVGKTYEFFPEMTDLFQEIIALSVPENKPVIGKRIYHVESGIHVDGILKQPKCYEPFPPDIVGLSRQIVLGKHSGSASVRVKTDELGISLGEDKIPKILECIKILSAKKNGAVTDCELKEICKEYG